MELTFILIFWVGMAAVFYTYLGYGLVLFFFKTLKKALWGYERLQYTEDELPEVTLIVAAYNEAYIIEEKIKNCLQQDYPHGKLKFLFVTDGSDDGTPDLVRQYPQINLQHKDERKGKLNAVERVFSLISSPIVVFTDANTFLNAEAVRNIARLYKDERVGAVAGEKRVGKSKEEAAAGAGEGIYWKYESKLKQWDAELYSVVGAAGELFSIRKELYKPVPKDTIIEDFYTTLMVAQEGYRVEYEPDAYASEGSSASVKEELKRKIRIAAGGIQAIVRLWRLLNIFKYGVLTFQYISHRVLRWTLAPLALLLIFMANVYLAWHGSPFYQVVLVLQIIFYLMAAVGWALQSKVLKIKVFFIPYYFTMMNYAVYRGFFRYLKGSQSAVWEKAKRV